MQQADKATPEQLNQQLARAEGYLQVDPGNTELLAMVIDLSLTAGDIARAQRHVDAACGQYPQDPFFQYRRGHVLVAQQRWSEAAPLFAAVLAAHPDANVAFSLAECQFRGGDYVAALATMEGYRADPALAPEAAILLVRALHHVGDFEGAQALVAAHRERLAGVPVFLAAASLMYMDDGKVEEATAMSDAALAGGVRPLEALVVNASLALAHANADIAIERYNEVLSMNPREGRSWSGLGMASLLRRDLAGAAVQLEQALVYMPGHIGTWHGLAWCRLFAQDMAGAAAAFDTALALDRNFGESHGGVAVVQALRGEREAAEASIRRALGLDPQSLSARYAQMVLSGQTSDPERFKAIAYRVMGMHKTITGESLASLVKRQVGD